MRWWSHTVGASWIADRMKANHPGKLPGPKVEVEQNMNLGSVDPLRFGSCLL